jgi:hypothetical protein
MCAVGILDVGCRITITAKSEILSTKLKTGSNNKNSNDQNICFEF